MLYVMWASFSLFTYFLLISCLYVFQGYLTFLLLVFRKFLGTNRRFVMGVDSDIRDDYNGPN